MPCYNCRSIDTEEDQIISYFSWAGDNPHFIENLPARVCRVCGPTSFTGKTVRVMEKINAGEVAPVGSRSVKVFDFNNPMAAPANTRGTGSRESAVVT